MSRRWKWFLPGYILALPGTLIGLLLLPLYGVQGIYLSDGCIEVETRRAMLGGKFVAAQTWGNLIYYRGAFRDSARLRVHERVHVWQAMVFTWPLQARAYVGHYVINLATGLDHYEAYRGIIHEKQAYRLENKEGVWGNE